jgi:hypothetical protein
LHQYLSHLLVRFLRADHVVLLRPDGSRVDQSLTAVFAEALYEKNIAHQRESFKYVADTSLYVAGFFQDSLIRKGVHISYYVQLGVSSYTSLQGLVQQREQKNLYCSLADSFQILVDVLAEFSSKVFGRTEQDLLRIYEVWMDTQSTRARRQLAEQGILPPQGPHHGARSPSSQKKTFN